MTFRSLPVLVTFVTGLIMILAFVSGPAVPGMARAEAVLPVWAQIITGFTMFIGIFSLLAANIRRIARRAEGWPYHLTLVGAFLGTFVIGLARGFQPATEIDGIGQAGGLIEPLYRLILDGIVKTGHATMFSLVAFFMASAAFRAFRARSGEASLLLITAAIVMLGNIPLGRVIDDLAGPVVDPLLAVIGAPWQASPHFSMLAIKDWVMNVPSSAAQTAILIGTVLGALSAAFKVLTGIDRSHLGGEV